MTTLRAARVALLALAITACETPQKTGQPPPTKGFPPGDVRESVYLPLERSAPVPRRYGLYTVLLTRTANRNTVRLLSELFRTTGGAGDAAIARENLNLILIPVKSAPEAARALASARNEPDPTAAAVTQKFYDYGQAALLMASVCRPDRGAAIMQVCGSASPDGPLLVTSQRPLDGSAPAGERLLVVNLSTTPAEAVPEVMAAYRRQVMRRDFDNRDELDGWRLQALNHLITAAQLLPSLSKAYAVSK
jgi:hypothetical protein